MKIKRGKNIPLSKLSFFADRTTIVVIISLPFKWKYYGIALVKYHKAGFVHEVKKDE